MPTNRLLKSLSPASRKLVISHCAHVALAHRRVISEAGESPSHAYFMTSGMASEVVTLADGEVVEIGLVGYEGLTGTFHLLGPSRSISQCFVQVAGQAYELPFPKLQEFFNDLPDVRRCIHRYIQHQLTHLGQTAACNRIHDAGPRFARWLLTAQDRSAMEEFTLTQDFLAQMLGTGRTTISIISKMFERQKFVRHNRGRISILDRPGLEGIACPCYEVTRGTLLELYS
jgi:CRP-like cAMP-binding protein